MQKKCNLCFSFCLMVIVLIFISESAFADSYDVFDSYDTSIKPSATVVATQTIRTAVTQTSKLVSGRISKIISPKPKGRVNNKSNLTMLDFNSSTLGSGVPTGMSAGGSPTKFGLWVNASFTNTDDDSIAAHSSADLLIMMLGADYKPTSKMVFGVALGYESGETETYFNTGEIDSDGISFTPYFAYLINNNFSFDLTGSYSWLDYDQFRTDGSGNRIDSSLDSNRWFVSTALHAYKTLGNWNVTGNLNYTISKESQDAFEESNGTQINENDVDLSTIGVGVETSYLINVFEPYVSLGYNYDTDYDAIPGYDYDRDAFETTLGSRIYWTDNLSGELSWNKVIGRDDQSEDSFIFNIRYEF